jgi:hypothetical protein
MYKTFKTIDNWNFGIINFSQLTRTLCPSRFSFLGSHFFSHGRKIGEDLTEIFYIFPNKIANFMRQ